MTAVAFYAPMKSPEHPVPSGDRRIARLTMRALSLAGFAPELASGLRVLDLAGDAAVQAQLQEAADAEVSRLIAHYGGRSPALWFTYHSHYKAPDLIGPPVSAALGMPYVLSEPSISPRRRDGPWADFAMASEAAVAAADRLFWTTERDRPALEAAGHAAKMVHLPPFLEEGPAPQPRGSGSPLRLMTVAMMRPGDKVESYRRLAVALPHLAHDWRLDVLGDGPARAEVEALLTPHRDRVTFHGAISEDADLRRTYEAADLMVWPGVGEGIGMVWLEAQAAGCPVVAADGPAARDVVGGGTLAQPDNPRALASAIAEAADRRADLSAAARAHVEGRHSLKAAAGRLAETLAPLIGSAPREAAP